MSEEILNQITGEVKAFVAKSNEEIEAHGKLGRKNADELKALNEKVEEVQASVLAAEQAAASAAERAQAEAVSRMSLGDQIVASEAFGSFQAGAKSASLEIMNANTTSAPGETGTGGKLESFVAPNRLAGVQGSPFLGVDCLDFISMAATASNLVEYTKMTNETDSVDAVAENSAMSASDYQFGIEQQPVQKIGSFLVVTRETMDDAPAVASFINTRLAYNVRRDLESQVITGNGTSPNLSGISSNSTAYSAVAGDNGLYFERIRKMITGLQTAGYAPSAIFVAPATLQELDLQSDSSNVFIASDPRAFNLPVAWGVPIIQSTNVPADVAIVGDWNMASTLFMRQGTEVAMYEQDASNVRSGLVTIAATTRAAYCTYDDAAIQYGDILSDA